jgi:hypothetical protein
MTKCVKMGVWLTWDCLWVSLWCSDNLLHYFWHVPIRGMMMTIGRMQPSCGCAWLWAELNLTCWPFIWHKSAHLETDSVTASLRNFVNYLLDLMISYVRIACIWKKHFWPCNSFKVQGPLLKSLEYKLQEKLLRRFVEVTIQYASKYV